MNLEDQCLLILWQRIKMKYHNISENIIGCKEFIPSQEYDLILKDILNNRHLFNVPSWTNKKELFSEACGGLDFWISKDNEKEINAPTIKNLKGWFFHQGLFHYLAQRKEKNVFDLLYKNFEWDIHVISYNNKGYYNWHCDGTKNNLFTFNLIVNPHSSLLGGEQLFMDKNDIIETPNEDNSLFIFPTYIPHAIKPLKSKNNKDVAFLEQRFSIQYWCRLADV